jgi:RND superfamily putative drug exporter
MTRALTRYSFQHPRRTALCWLAGLILLIAFGAVAGGDLTTDDEFLSHPESQRADDLLGRQWGARDESNDFSELLVVRSQDLTLDDPAYRAVVEQLVNALQGPNGAQAETIDWYQASAGGDERAELLASADRTATLIPYQPHGDITAADEAVKQVAAGAPGFEVHFVSEDRFDDAMDSATEHDLVHAELFGLPAALIVLIVVFGSLVAAGLPIVLAIVSILGAVGLTLLLASQTTMSVYALNMISMIGLAVGVDYALFIVDRFRHEQRSGADPVEAMERAAATAGRAVAFSGVTVAISLLGVLLLPTTLFRSLGAGAILVVLVALVATLTLLPALLALAGSALDWPRRARRPASAGGDVASDRLVRLVLRRPAISAVAALAFLLVLALPAFSMERGTAGIESMPPGDLRSGYEILAQHFSAGMTEPVQIVIEGNDDAATNAALDGMLAALAKDTDFGAPTGRSWNASGTLGLVEVPLAIDGNNPDAYAAVDRLRNDLIPAAFQGTGAQVLVGGEVAENADFDVLVDRWTPRVLTLVLGLSFVILLLAFRSIVVPLKAILLNLLSVGAAYGAMVLVFQDGHGAGLLGFQRTPTIEAWIPIFLFSILFGLSMDYHIFLLSRIREAWDRTGDNHRAVAEGLHATRRIITGAAAIMVVVFAAFASGDLVMFQQLGFGLAVAILLDATIIRLVLVPATMTLLGNWNWYLPRWLDWMPRLQIEPPAAAAPPAGAD